MTNEEAIKFLSQIMDALLASNSWLPSTDNPIKESFGMAINALTAQPETHEERTETHGVCLDTIDRQATLDWLKNEWNGMVTSLFDGIKAMPSAQPDLDEVYAHAETEAEAKFHTEHTEIVRCKDCKYWNDEFAKDKSTCWLPCMSMTTHREWHCGSAERRTDETDNRKE